MIIVSRVITWEMRRVSSMCFFSIAMLTIPSFLAGHNSHGKRKLITPIRRFLSLVFTCLCIIKPLLLRNRDRIEILLIRRIQMHFALLSRKKAVNQFEYSGSTVTAKWQ